MIVYISNLIIPLFFLIIALYGYFGKTDVYSAFTEGVKRGIITVYEIVPSLIGLFCAVSVFRASGLMDFLILGLTPLCKKINFPPELFSLCTVKMLSSSAAMGILTDIFKTFGPDSFLGRCASAILSSTETIFYTMSVYFASIGIKNSRGTLFCAILANLAGICASIFFVSQFFGGG